MGKSEAVACIEMYLKRNMNILHLYHLHNTVLSLMVRSHPDMLGPLVSEGGGHVPDQPAAAHRQPTRRRRQTQAGGHFVLLRPINFIKTTKDVTSSCDEKYC